MEDMSMLVLTRKPGERIVIGAGITVVVNRVKNGRVTIGIEAPQDVSIQRSELTPRCQPSPPLVKAR
jgi:carbon storage regulator